MGRIHDLAAAVLERSREVSHCPAPYMRGTAGQRDSRPEIDDWRDYFEERAAIAEYDGGLRRDKAEASALERCVTRWLHLNPPERRGSPEACAHCADGIEGGRVILPYGVESMGGVAWVQATCWPNWSAARHRTATEALAALGVGLQL